MAKLLNWFKTDLTYKAVLFLIAFIPLYPKLPLLDIFGTWVYVRLEDVLILFAILIFIYERIKKPPQVKNKFIVPISVYLAIGLVSAIYSIVFIGPHLANYFPHLTLLHFARRIEYMSLFFLAFYAVDSRKKLKQTIGVLVFTVVTLVFYGFGQKFMGWPAFLTMNEEFAKGLPLRLPPTARIPSTFGGHYDLAAYLVLVIPILGSLVFSARKILMKLFYLLLCIGAYILLLFTASRISFGVYLVAISAMLSWHKKYILIPVVIVASFFMMNFVSGASERFYKTLRFSDVIVDLSTGQPIGTLDEFNKGQAVVAKQEEPDKENLPTGSGFIGVPSETPTKSVKSVQVFISHELATGSGEIATISGSFLVQKALVYDISITTRFQGQWPKAIEAFKRNVLLGSGFSTLSVASDGDYLRLLGETGILGFLGFVGIFLFAFHIYSRNKSQLEPLEKSFVIGVFAGLLGLALNAILIDVFEASKVAYSMWLLLGISLVILLKAKDIRMSYPRFMASALTGNVSFVLYIFIIGFVIFSGIFGIYFIGDDFTWLRWAAQSQFRDIVKYFLQADGFFYRPLPKILYFIQYSFFWLKTEPYHFISLFLYMGSAVSIYVTSRILNINKWISLVMAIFFLSMPIHHENVYWISGQSSLLGGLFIFQALALAAYAWKRQPKYSWLLFIFSMLWIFAGTLSYDGYSLVPLAFVILDLVYRPKWKINWGFLVLIPVYWYLRTNANSLFQQGDYTVNISKLPVNMPLNIAGYTISFLAGVKAIDTINSLRAAFKANFQPILAAVLLSATAAAGLLVRFRKQVRNNLEIAGWLFGTIIALSGFAGLGGMAERYALLGSGFFVILTGLTLSRTAAMSKFRGIFYTAIAIILVLTAINIIEMKKTEEQWKFAGNVTQNSLLSFKNNYFPLSGPKTFVFVDTPIRYGRAWIFPTGMKDPLWHMFKFNQVPYEATSAADIKSAFDYVGPVPSKEVLKFDNYKLKMISVETKVVEE